MTATVVLGPTATREEWLAARRLGITEDTAADHVRRYLPDLHADLTRVRRLAEVYA